jgi:hypothetical protein
MHTRLLFLMTLAAGTILAQERPAAAPGETTEEDWKVHVELHVFTLPEKKAFALLPELRDETKIAGAWKKLEEMVAKGEAKLVAAPGGTTTHGNKIALSEGEQVHYPSEFESPQIIETREERENGPAAPEAEEVKPAAKTGAGAGGKGEVKAGAQKKDPPIAYAINTFETRLVGIQFGGEVSVSADGRRLLIDAVSSHTWLPKWDEFEVGRLSNNEKILVKQPRFSVATSSSQLGLNSGERTLLSIHRVPESKGEMELFLLRAWTTPRKAVTK